MKVLIRSLFVLCLGLLLTACSIGNGRICGPQTPKVNCDKEALQKLQHPTPYLQKWKKVGVTPEMRREDAFNCGGKRSDTHPDQVDNDEELMLPNENIFDTRKRLLEMWKACMSDKEYHYHRQ